MREASKREEAGAALLFELRGPKPGSAYPVTEAGLRIGSGQGSDLLVKGRDVMPSQLEIRPEQGEFVVKNLSREGSVFLNGDPFEEAVLQKGDILTVGEAMYRYVEPGETLSQEELWRPVGGRRAQEEHAKTPFRRASFLMVLTVVAVGATLLIMITQGNKVEKPKEGAFGKLTDLESPVDREELKVRYEHGKDLMAARRWDEALIVFEGIREKIPNFMDVETLYQEALVESGNVDILDYGKGLMMEQELALAKEQMERIPKSSVYYREAERLIREVEDQILEMRIRRAREALERSDWVFAQREAESILAKYPNNKEARRIVLDARLLHRQVADKRMDVPRAWRVTSPRKAGSADHGRDGWTGPEVKHDEPVPSGVEAQKPRDIRPRKAAPRGPIQRAVAAYRRGDVDGSMSVLQRVLEASKGDGGMVARKAAAMMEDLQNAMTFFQQARSLQEGGRYEEAVDLWERFLERDRNISGDRGGVYFSRASAFLARIYFQRGRREFERGNPIGAAFFWNMGRKINPKDADLRKGLSELVETARRIYREGYSLQEINMSQAIEKWKEVLLILPPDHPYYQKAKKRIDRYSESP